MNKITIILFIGVFLAFIVNLQGKDTSKKAKISTLNSSKFDVSKTTESPLSPRKSKVNVSSKSDESIEKLISKPKKSRSKKSKGLLLTPPVVQCLPEFRVTSPIAISSWDQCSYQAITWDGSGCAGLNEVNILLYGGDSTQINLGKFPNEHGYAQIKVPTCADAGLYRVRVYGYVPDGLGGYQLIEDQSPWFRINQINYPCY